jgi:hypothetical protein
LLWARGGSSHREGWRARILEERDLQRLERWLARAVHAASVVDVLAES